MSRMPSPSERRREHTGVRCVSESLLNLTGPWGRDKSTVLWLDFNHGLYMRPSYPQYFTKTLQFIVLRIFFVRWAETGIGFVCLWKSGDWRKFLPVSRKEWIHFREKNPHDLSKNMEFNHLDTQPGINQLTPSGTRKSAFMLNLYFSSWSWMQPCFYLPPTISVQNIY